MKLSLDRKLLKLLVGKPLQVYLLYVELVGCRVRSYSPSTGISPTVLS